MIKVTFGENTYECSRAVRGVNYIRLYDENNILIVSFEGVSDTTQFIIKDGEWESGVSSSVVTGSASLADDGTLNIIIPDSVAVETGLTINFVALASSAEVTALTINDDPYSLTDTNGNNAIGISTAFSQDAAVCIKINSNTKTAYLQTTNARPVAPMYSYGTEDLTAGVSALETGTLHFVYE